MVAREFERLRWTRDVISRRDELTDRWAKVRWVYWRHLRRYDGEVCHRCGRPVARSTNSWWHADDPLWIDVSGSFGILCPPCFHDLARAQGRMVFFIASEWSAAGGVGE